MTDNFAIVEIPILPEILETCNKNSRNIEKLFAELGKEKEVKNYSLKEACELKGVPNGTIKREWMKQPLLGISTRMLGEKRYWSHEQVMEWVDIFDEELPAYIERLISAENELIRTKIAGRLLKKYQEGKLPKKFHYLLYQIEKHLPVV